MNKTGTNHLPFSAYILSFAWGVIFSFVVVVVLLMLNLVCRSASLPLRYQTDQSPDDSKLKSPITHGEDTDLRKELIL
jgi:hypothetical protein